MADVKAESTPVKDELSEHEDSADQPEDEVEETRPVKKGRGRPKSAPGPETPVMPEDEVEETRPVKKGRGRPKSASGPTPVKMKSSKGRGRPKGTFKTDAEKKKAKKQRVLREPTIAPGTLREKPRLSYKDESSSEEEMWFHGEPVSSDSEADFKLEKKLKGVNKPAKKESGSLRERPRLSYKDDSESDMESGFESDVRVPQKSSPSQGKGRPKKNESTQKRGRGRSKKTSSSERKSTSSSPEKKKAKEVSKPSKSGDGKKDRSSERPSTQQPRGRPRGRAKAKKNYVEMSGSEGESEDEALKDEEASDDEKGEKGLEIDEEEDSE